MPTPKKGARLGGSPSHQKAILANLATSLFEHGAITTTEAKARMLRPYAERLITKAKRGDLHNRRQVASVIRDKTVVHVLFTELGPRYADRPGGYTRITKIGPRKGDNAPMAVIQLVTEELTTTARSTRSSSSPRSTASTGSTAATGAAGPAVSAEPADTTPAQAQTVQPVDTDTDTDTDTQAEAEQAVAEQEPDGETVEETGDADAPAEGEESK